MFNGTLYFTFKNCVSCIARRCRGESVGPVGRTLGSTEGWMFEVLHRPLRHACCTASRIHRHRVWIQHAQRLQLPAGRILQGEPQSGLQRHARLNVHVSLTPVYSLSSRTSVGKVAEGGVGGSHLLCGKPQSLRDEEQHWEVQTNGGGDRGGLPGQGAGERETLGEEGGMTSLSRRGSRGSRGCQVDVIHK